jgi:hypothetical protein
MTKAKTILVIYDQLDADLKYHVTTDSNFLRFSGVSINSTSTPEDLQNEVCDKLFEEDGSDKIDWKSISEVNQENIKEIDVIMTISFLP